MGNCLIKIPIMAWLRRALAWPFIAWTGRVFVTPLVAGLRWVFACSFMVWLRKVFLCQVIGWLRWVFMCPSQPKPGGPVTTTDTLEITEADEHALARRVFTSWGPVVLYARIRSCLLWRKYWFLFWLLSNPWGVRFTRWLADRLRRVHPVPRGLGVAVPLDAAALRDALSRPEDFNGAESMSLRLPAGEVVLGIDWQRRHDEERKRLEEALDVAELADAHRIRKIVRDRWDCALRNTTLDQVNLARLFEDVALDVSEGYLGIGAFDVAEREHLRPVIRSLASRVFQAPVPNTREDIFANIAADRMRRLVERCLADARTDRATNPQKPIAAMTVTQRLLRLCDDPSPAKPDWLTQDWVVRNMITLSVFGSVTSARAMTQAVPQMLNKDGRRHIGLLAAADYARAEQSVGHTETETYEPEPLTLARCTMRKVVFEAMRWHPMLSMLGARTALRDTALAPGTDNMTKVTAGTKVLPMLLGAMHDPVAFKEPHQFCPFDRKPEDYLHFGAGPHECVGRRMAEVQMEELAYALLSDDLVRNNPIKCGKVEYHGPAVLKLYIGARCR